MLNITAIAYSSMSTKHQSIGVQSYPVLPRQVTSDFVTACFASGDEMTHLTHYKQKKYWKAKLEINQLPVVSFIGVKIEDKNQISTLKYNHLERRLDWVHRPFLDNTMLRMRQTWFHLVQSHKNHKKAKVAATLKSKSETNCARTALIKDI